MAENQLKPQEDQFYEFKPFRVPKYQIKFEKAGKLSDIQGYVWYTPAALYLWGKFSDVNLSDIIQQTELQVFWYRFDKPIFRNFNVGPDASWNHTLWAAKETQWPMLVDKILESVQFDIPGKLLFQYALQRLNVYDPLFVDSKAIMQSGFPQILINAFAVLSNKGQYAFDLNKPSVPPGMVTFKPASVHVNAANRLFANANLTQENAFSRIKEIMLSEQDAEHETERKRQLKNERK